LVLPLACAQVLGLEDYRQGVSSAALVEKPEMMGKLTFGFESLAVETEDSALRVQNGVVRDAAYVNAGDVLDFPGTAAFTLEAWVEPTVFTFAMIVGKQRFEVSGKGGEPATEPGYMLWYDDNPNAIYFRRT
jgi:hypothetical protein